MSKVGKHRYLRRNECTSEMAWDPGSKLTDMRLPREIYLHLEQVRPDDRTRWSICSAFLSSGWIKADTHWDSSRLPQQGCTLIPLLIHLNRTDKRSELPGRKLCDIQGSMTSVRYLGRITLLPLSLVHTICSNSFSEFQRVGFNFPEYFSSLGKGPMLF